MEFLTGAIVGFIVAGLIGRAKFMTVQERLRGTIKNLNEAYGKYIAERNLNEGLTETLDDVAQRTRITGV